MNRYSFVNKYKKPSIILEGQTYRLNAKGMIENSKRIKEDLEWSNHNEGVRVTNTYPSSVQLGRALPSGSKDRAWRVEKTSDEVMTWEAISALELTKYYEQI